MMYIELKFEFGLANWDEISTQDENFNFSK